MRASTVKVLVLPPCSVTRAVQHSRAQCIRVTAAHFTPHYGGAQHPARYGTKETHLDTQHVTV